MDWKKENNKTRYIDSITTEEAIRISFLAMGEPEEFQLIRVDAKSNGNNIPHVEIHFKYLEPTLCEVVEDYIGIFEDLNTYRGKRFGSVYCQKELFEEYKKMGFE